MLRILFRCHNKQTHYQPHTQPNKHHFVRQRPATNDYGRERGLNNKRPQRGFQSAFSLPCPCLQPALTTLAKTQKPVRSESQPAFIIRLKYALISAFQKAVRKAVFPAQDAGHRKMWRASLSFRHSIRNTQCPGDRKRLYEAAEFRCSSFS